MEHNEENLWDVVVFTPNINQLYNWLKEGFQNLKMNYE